MIPKLFDETQQANDAPHHETMYLTVLSTLRSCAWGVGNIALVVWVMYASLVLMPSIVTARKSEAEHMALIEEAQKRQIVNNAHILLGQRKIAEVMKNGKPQEK